MTALDLLPRLPGPTRARHQAPGHTAGRLPDLGPGAGPVQRVADATVWLLFRLDGVRS